MKREMDSRQRFKSNQIINTVLFVIFEIYFYIKNPDGMLPVLRTFLIFTFFNFVINYFKKQDNNN